MASWLSWKSPMPKLGKTLNYIINSTFHKSYMVSLFVFHICFEEYLLIIIISSDLSAKLIREVNSNTKNLTKTKEIK